MGDAEVVLETAQQTSAAPAEEAVVEEAVVEEEVQASGDIPVKTDEQVAEVKTSSNDAPVENDENAVEAKGISCLEKKGSGKTNLMTRMMSGTRGFSLMKRRSTTQVAKAGA